MYAAVVCLHRPSWDDRICPGEVAKLSEAFDTNKEIKAYDIGASNSLRSAALVLEGKLDEAKRVHSQHPMQAHRDEILKPGQVRKITG